MKLDARLVEVFHALMTVGTVTGAAALLNTSQPAVSRSLQRLESVTGMRLFSRVRGGRLSPTAQATALFEEVDKALLGLERIGHVAERLKHFHAGAVSIVCAPVFSGSFVASAVARFNRRHDGVGLSIDTQNSPVIAEMMTAQMFDIGLVAYPLDPPGTVSSLFAEPEEVCVLPCDHPLAAKTELSLQELQGESWIFMAGHDPYRHRVDKMFQAAGIERKVVAETPNSATVCALVGQGVGIAIMSPFAAVENLDRGLTMRRLTVSLPFTTTLIRAEHRPKSPLTELFISELLAVRDEYLNLARIRLA